MIIINFHKYIIIQRLVYVLPLVTRHECFRVKELEKSVGKGSPKAGRNGKLPSTPQLSHVNKQEAVRQSKSAQSPKPSQRSVAQRSPKTFSPKPSAAGSQRAPASFSKQILRDHVSASKPLNRKSPPGAAGASNYAESGDTRTRNHQQTVADKGGIRNQMPSPENPLATDSIRRNPFAAANIIYASTPKKTLESTQTMDPLGSPFDVSKIMKDDAGTPLRDHRLNG